MVPLLRKGGGNRVDGRTPGMTFMLLQVVVGVERERP